MAEHSFGFGVFFFVAVVLFLFLLYRLLNQNKPL